MLVKLLSPMTPHITAELWDQKYPGQPSVHQSAWPVADPALVAEETVTMVVQINGKVKTRLEVPPTINEDDATTAALGDPSIIDALGGASPSRVVSRPPRLVNIIL